MPDSADEQNKRRQMNMKVAFKPKIKKSTGTEINPPPIPKYPAKKPTGNAVSIINKISK